MNRAVEWVQKGKLKKKKGRIKGERVDKDPSSLCSTLSAPKRWLTEFLSSVKTLFLYHPIIRHCFPFSPLLSHANSPSLFLPVSPFYSLKLVEEGCVCVCVCGGGGASSSNWNSLQGLHGNSKLCGEGKERQRGWTNERGKKRERESSLWELGRKTDRAKNGKEFPPAPREREAFTSFSPW